MASIEWTDAVHGGQSIDNAKGAYGGRFTNWTPKSVPVGDKKNTLATGQLHVFRFRTDHSASFEMRGIPNTYMQQMLWLQYHLENGGQVTVHTDDPAGRDYTCALAPGSDVGITLSDARMIEYTMTFNLLNAAVSPDVMRCEYF